MKIHYEPHPVPPERKAELHKKGLKIIDAKFEPPSRGVETRSNKKAAAPAKTAKKAAEKVEEVESNDSDS